MSYNQQTIVFRCEMIYKPCGTEDNFIRTIVVTEKG